MSAFKIQHRSKISGSSRYGCSCVFDARLWRSRVRRRTEMVGKCLFSLSWCLSGNGGSVVARRSPETPCTMAWTTHGPCVLKGYDRRTAGWRQVWGKPFKEPPTWGQSRGYSMASTGSPAMEKSSPSEGPKAQEQTPALVDKRPPGKVYLAYL